jgi:Flp pilus assembly protein CpaB
MKRRSWLWIFTSVILAVLAGVVAIVVLNQAAERGTTVVPSPKQPVVVARNPIAANAILRADNVLVEERDEIPSGAAVRTQDVLGQMALRDIPSGEVILMQDVASVGFSSGITETKAMLLGDDKIAVALPANDILSKWGAVVPGDHVDVLVTLDVVLETPIQPEDMPTSEQGLALLAMERDQSLDNVSMLTIQDLEVLQILTEPQPEGATANQEEGQPAELRPRALVLKINPQDAVVLKYLRNSSASIDVALRSPTNSTLFDVQPVNINYLVLRYGIVVPTTP